MPTRTSTDQSVNYVKAGLAGLLFGVLASILGTVVVEPANAWLILLGDLVILTSLLLIIVSLRNAKKTSKTKAKSKKR